MAALILIYRDKPEGRRADGEHAYLVDAADVAAAMTSVGVSEASWCGVEVAATAALPVGRSLLRFDGDCISLLGISRGGSPVGLE